MSPESPITKNFDLPAVEHLRTKVQVIEKLATEVELMRNRLTAYRQLADPCCELDIAHSALQDAAELLADEIDRWFDRNRPIRLSERDEYVLNCSPSDYPWDRWAERATDAGVSQELTNLGRSLMREAYQHSWTENLCIQAGWIDAGQAMITLATERPSDARSQWEKLLSNMD